ncbi:MAG: D-alanyl-D-alanine carboxypeptidase family protein [Thermomicrobiales bacterium]
MLGRSDDLRLCSRMLYALALTLVILVAPVAGIAASAKAQDGAPTLEPPKTGAQAVYAYDVTAGIPLYSLNADEQREPASLTKMASVLVIMKYAGADLDQQVEINQSDVATADESRVGFQAGDVVTMKQLLYGMLLPSGNDAAHAAARVVGAKIGGIDVESADSIAVFVGEMNALASKLGLSNTQFQNPVGLNEDGHYSSAHDLAVLAAEVMKQDILQTIVSTATYQLEIGGPAARSVELTNTNKLLGVDDRVLGVKTGSTDTAGGCLAVAVNEGPGNEVIVVELGDIAPVYDDVGNTISDPRFDDMQTILDGIEHDFVWIDPKSQKEITGLPDAMAAWQVGLKDGPAIVVPRDATDKLQFRMRLGPAAKSGEEVGDLLFYIGDAQIGDWKLYQMPITS